MTTPKRIVWWLVGILGVCLVFGVGVEVGMYLERQQFEFAQAVSVVVADDYLAQGKNDKAILMLHFAKSTERISGDTDGLLAKAYFANGESCLAQDFADSHLRYMERNKLTSLSSYAVSQQLYDRAAAACAQARREGRRVASGAN